MSYQGCFSRSFWYFYRLVVDRSRLSIKSPFFHKFWGGFGIFDGPGIAWTNLLGIGILVCYLILYCDRFLEVIFLDFSWVIWRIRFFADWTFLMRRETSLCLDYWMLF